MPQLVKGGKYVFGWSRIDSDGKIKIPQEAFIEYSFRTGEKVVLISGSKTSGGFGIFKYEKFQDTLIKSIVQQIEGIFSCNVPINKSIHYKNRHYCWTLILEHECIILPDEILIIFPSEKEDPCRLLKTPHKE